MASSGERPLSAKAIVEGGKTHIMDREDSSDIFDDTKSSLPELLGFQDWPHTGPVFSTSPCLCVSHTFPNAPARPEEDEEKEIYCSSRGEGQFISDL